MKSRFFILVGLIVALFSTNALAQCPPNVDFELGNTSMWNYFVGSCCPINTPTPTAAITNRHTLTSGTGWDRYGLFPVVAPGGGSYSMRLGNDSVFSDAEKARYYVRVPAGSSTYSLVYRYAMVLENPSHSATDQPRFEVKAYDSATGNPVNCAQFTYVSSSVLPGFRESAIRSQVFFRDWTTATINLSGLGGRTVAVDFASGDCGLGGHFGYGYIDMTCGLFAVTIISCDTTYATVIAPDGFMRYQWFDSSFTTAYDTTQIAVLPISSVPRVFAVILTPYTGYGCPDTLFTRIIPSRLELNCTRDTTLCAATPITLTSGATDILPIVSYRWMPATGLSCTTCANPVATPTVTTTYTVTVTDSGGCLRSDTIRIQIGGVTAIQNHTDVACYGDSTGTAVVIPTRGAPPYYYSWSTVPVRTTQSVSGLPAGTYTVTITDTGRCAGVQVITINQPPPLIMRVTGTTNPSTCGGSDGSIQLTGFVTGTSYIIRYLFGGATYSITQTATGTGSITINGLRQGVYDSIRVYTTGCPYNIIMGITLTDPPIPAIPVVTPQRYCQYDVASPVIAVGSSMLWYGPGITGSSIAPTPNTSYPHIDTYYVTQTVAGCTSARARDIITIFPKPPAPITTDTTYCQYDIAAQLTALGDSLKWYSVPSGGVAIEPAPIPSTAIVGLTNYYVTQTNDGCTSDRATLGVTTLILPDFTITPSAPFACQYDTLLLNYTGATLTLPGYLWELGPGQRLVSGTMTSDGIGVRFDSTLFQTVTLTASSYNGRCKVTKTIDINVVPEPKATAYLKENICVDDSITVALNGRTSNAHHYTWDFSGATIISANSNTGGPYIVRWSTLGAHIITLRAFTAEGCRGRLFKDTIKVMPRPSALFTYRTLRSKICSEDSVLLLAIDSSNYRNAYTWHPQHYFFEGNGPKAWGKIDNSGFITLNVVNEFGCTASDSIYLNTDQCCKVSFPTAFTPNGDGKNDVFRPIFEGFHRFSVFRVVNRWGQTVFETTNSNGHWDGTLNGEPQDLGVYFYMLKYECNNETVIEKGEVTLIR